MKGPIAEQVRGHLTAIRYHSEETGFVIAALALDGDRDRSVTVKGTMAAPQVGAGVQYVLTGQWVEDPRWGRQFAFETCQTQLPRTAAAVMVYLREQCKGVGVATAKKIVDILGGEALERIKADPVGVAAAIGGGLTAERATVIAERLRAVEAREAVALGLAQLLEGTGVGGRLRAKIQAEFAKVTDVLALIRANPYVLMRVDGVGFVKADMVARRLGIPFMGQLRCCAGLEHALGVFTKDQGHVRIPKDLLIPQTAQLLGIPGAVVELEAALVALVAAGDVHVEGTAVYLRGAWEDEQTVARCVAGLLRDEPRVKMRVSTEATRVLAADQREALELAARSSVFICTGAPGTGKSFLVKYIIDSLPDARVELCAPTGKAAKRLMELCPGREARTIHRVLGPERDAQGRFRFVHGAYDKLACDVVVVDEFSMVDNWLAARLLLALAPGTRLIIVGDHYQLPSVGPGNVLRDLIASGVVPAVELREIKRQEGAGLIVRSCHSIKDGGDVCAARGVGQDDLHFIERGTEQEVAGEISVQVARFAAAGWDPLRQVQVIAPLRERTGLSCAALNAGLQAQLNGTAVVVEGTVFRVGDKVIQTKNDYDADVVNGDVGFVERIDAKRRRIVVEFDNPRRMVELPLASNALALAYAVTCHKFQGSEADVVIIPVHPCFGGLVVQRSWLYTAVSRARRCCVLVGQRATVGAIVARVGGQERWTGLQEAVQFQQQYQNDPGPALGAP
jgi:exodeoxyribonuclease V alpha subunit